MERKYNANLIDNAKSLRKGMTKEERHLWYDFLRSYPVKFRRQAVINKYIADFYCPGAKLIIELDGSQHFEEKGLEYDEKRTSFLEQYGLTVIRIANNMINKQFRAVCEYIDNCVRQIIQSPQSPDGASSPC
ncbi:MAG: endonuclease domain-containing protein [Clostridia bacterium]|nr:endonuclease domain-containing protein [Clostridia bacterium]